MSEFFLTLFSAAAYAAFLPCFAALSSGAALRAGGTRGIASSALCAAAFFFVPAGSLPPFIASGYGGFAAALTLFAAAFLIFPRRADAAVFPSAFCAAWGAAAVFASLCGAPGWLASFGTYSAMPVWSAAGGWGTAGGVCMFAALLCAFPDFSTRGGAPRPALPEALYAALCAALIAAFFAPQNVSALAEIGGFLGFFADFVFFWVKTAFVGFCASRARRFAGRVSRGRETMLCAAFSLCGAVCAFAAGLP